MKLFQLIYKTFIFIFLLWDNILKTKQFHIRIQGWDIPKTCILENNLNLVKSQPSYIFRITYNQLRKWRRLSNWLWIFYMFYCNFLFLIQMNWSWLKQRILINRYLSDILICIYYSILFEWLGTTLKIVLGQYWNKSN